MSQKRKEEGRKTLVFFAKRHQMVALIAKIAVVTITCILAFFIFVIFTIVIFNAIEDGHEKNGGHLHIKKGVIDLNYTQHF